MSRVPHTGLAEAPAPYSHARLDAAAVRSMLDAAAPLKIPDVSITLAEVLD